MGGVVGLDKALEGEGLSEIPKQTGKGALLGTASGAGYFGGTLAADTLLHSLGSRMKVKNKDDLVFTVGLLGAALAPYLAHKGMNALADKKEDPE